MGLWQGKATDHKPQRVAAIPWTPTHVGHAKAVNHPSMATGEVCAHIQGLGTNPAPKSEPLDTSTQSADASTSNSGRAPGIQPQE
ncbi:UNVERIFIED_CONTAM: hypothetical protein FKN15_068698 [Acipenser sinensis]